MKTKLTLTVEEDAVRRMKRLAKRRKTSVSALFEQWSAQYTNTNDDSPLSVRLQGKWQSQATETSDEDLRLAYLLEKHAK